MKLNQEEREAVDRIVFSEDFKVLVQTMQHFIDQQATRCLAGGFRDEKSIAYDVAVYEGMTKLKHAIEGLKGKAKQ
jgi:hypothetical protein